MLEYRIDWGPAKSGGGQSARPHQSQTRDRPRPSPRKQDLIERRIVPWGSLDATQQTIEDAIADRAAAKENRAAGV
jgi:hypothetical protein